MSPSKKTLSSAEDQLTDSKRDLSAADCPGRYYIEPEPPEGLRRIIPIRLAKDRSDASCRRLFERFYEFGADDPEQIASAAKLF
jgi:hypothetical protein